MTLGALTSVNMRAVFKRELRGYFETPVAYVFIVVFLMISGIFTFYLGRFYENNQATLEPFFAYHPWLYLFLIPAISMRLWSEERRLGTIEMLMTMPITTTEAVLGKFFAAWLFSTIALLLTFPIWITVNYLGDPDNGAIIAGYIGSAILASGYLAISSCISSMTRNQVVSFVVSVTICFMFIVSGFPLVLDFFSGLGFAQTIIDTISSFSFLSHSNEMMMGIISLKNIVYFLTLVAFWLFINILVVNAKRD